MLILHVDIIGAQEGFSSPMIADVFRAEAVAAGLSVADYHHHISLEFRRVQCNPLELSPRGGGSEHCAARLGQLDNVEWVLWGRYENVKPGSFVAEVQLVQVSAPEEFRFVAFEFSRSRDIAEQARELWYQLVKP